MATFRVHQIRSGEGWILSDPSNLGPEALSDDLSDLVVGPLLVASADFDTWTPPGGEKLGERLYAFRGEAAKTMLRDWKRWSSRRAIFACLPTLPDEDARRRWIADALRPWDAERLKATAYGQLGREWAQRGTWFASERDRSRFIEVAVTRVLSERGNRLPNGDVTIVLEMPADSTFDAQFKVSGNGESLNLRRDFPSQQMSREWSIRKGEWEAVESRSSAGASTSWRVRLTQHLATVAILLMSIPVFLLVVIVALIAKFTGSSTTVSTSAKAAPH